MTISSIRLLKKLKRQTDLFSALRFITLILPPVFRLFWIVFFMPAAAYLPLNPALPSFRPDVPAQPLRLTSSTSISPYPKLPVVSSSYWNNVHGISAEQVSEDKEGLQTMRNIGHNMAWMLKCIEKAKNDGIELPRVESGERTNFIR